MTQYQKSGIFRQAGTVPGQKKIGTVPFLCDKPGGRPNGWAGLPAQTYGHPTGKYSERHLCRELCASKNRTGEVPSPIRLRDSHNSRHKCCSLYLPANDRSCKHDGRLPVLSHKKTPTPAYQQGTMFTSRYHPISGHPVPCTHFLCNRLLHGHPAYRIRSARFSPEGSHTEGSRRFMRNAFSRWRSVSDSLHLLYSRMFTA